MSFQGTLGPFVKGSSASAAVKVSAALASGFTAGAITVFGLAHLAGAALGVHLLSTQWLLAVAAVGLGACAVADAFAIRKRRYCPLSWRRQTPQSLRFRYGPTTTAVLWGFDTGLAVTTFRVAALTWAALLLTFLGLAPWQTGLAYALSFAVPIVTILNVQRPTSRSSDSLGALLDKRAALQCVSLIGLLVATLALVTAAVS